MTLGSLAGGCCARRVISPSLVPSDPLPLFLFFSTASPKGAHVGVGVGSRGTIETVGVLPPACAVSNASKFGVFSSRTIAFRMLGASLLVLIEAMVGWQ